MMSCLKDQLDFDAVCVSPDVVKYEQLRKKDFVASCKVIHKCVLVAAATGQTKADLGDGQVSIPPFMQE